jgi:hypothetical protein
MHRAAKYLEEMDEEEEAFEEDFDDFGIESDQGAEPRGRRRSINFSGRERGSSVSGRQRRASISGNFMFAAEMAEEDANETFEETLREINSVFKSVNTNGNVAEAIRKVSSNESLSRSSQGASRRRSLDSNAFNTGNKKNTSEGGTRPFGIRVGRKGNQVRPQTNIGAMSSEHIEGGQQKNDTPLITALSSSTQDDDESRSTEELPVKKRLSVLDDDDDEVLKTSSDDEEEPVVDGQAAREAAAAIKLQSLARQMLSMFRVRGMFEALSRDEEEALIVENPAEVPFGRSETFARSETAELGVYDDFTPTSPLHSLAGSEGTSLPELESAEAEMAKVMHEMDLMLHGGDEAPTTPGGSSSRSSSSIISSRRNSNEALKSPPSNEDKASAGTELGDPALLDRRGNTAKTVPTIAPATSASQARPRFSMDGVKDIFDRPVVRQSPAISHQTQSSSASADPKLKGAAAKCAPSVKSTRKSREIFWGSKAEIALQPTPPSPSNLPIPPSGLNTLAHPSPRKLPHPPASFLPAALPPKDKTKARATSKEDPTDATSKQAASRSKFAF